MKNPYTRKNPYIEYGKVAKRLKPQNAGVGFLPDLEAKVESLEKVVASLEDRLRYRYSKGVPCAYVGGKEYAPETNVVTLDVEGEGTTVEPVNYLLRSGIDYQIPITLQGPGVFLARSMNVVIYSQQVSNSGKKRWCKVPFGRQAMEVNDWNQTLKHSVRINSVLEAYYGINFFWNLTDGDSGRKLSDDLIPDLALNPQGYAAAADGFTYRFETPWLFERANTVLFDIRFINDLFQLDTTATLTPKATPQNVRIQVELHGTKFYNERDTLLREAT